MTVTIFLISLMGAMAIGVPVAFSLIICGIALMAWLGIYDSQIVAQKILDGADNFVLLAIPFFLLAGELMNAGGLSKRIVNFALALIGHRHGGLGAADRRTRGSLAASHARCCSMKASRVSLNELASGSW